MSKRKKFDRQKHNNNILIGCQFMWHMIDPLSDDAKAINDTTSHRVKGKRLMMKRNLRKLYEITNQRKLKWRVSISVLFKHDGRFYSRDAEQLIHGFLRDADAQETFEKSIEEIFAVSNMKHYVRCEFMAEVIGTDAIAENDFTIAACEAA